MGTVSFYPALFRQHFPAVAEIGTYLDNAATTLKPQAMIQATQAYYQFGSTNIRRSQHKLAQTTTAQFEHARSLVAEFIHAENTQNIIWTQGTTHSINMITQCYASQYLTKGDEIIVSELEHHSNLIPWIMVAQKTGAKIIRWPIEKDLSLDPERLLTLLTPKSKMLAITQMSNVTGTQPELARIVQIAKHHHLIVAVDGAQGIVHRPIHVNELDIDFYAFSAHKLYGPTGLGVLYAKTAHLAAMSPMMGGGKMLDTTTFSDYSLADIPMRFEAGTPNIAAVLGFSASLEWLKHIDLEQAEQYCCYLADQARALLTTIPGFVHYNVANSSLLTFNIKTHHANDIAILLAEQHIALRDGQHCAQPLMAALNIPHALRASFAPYNDLQDVEHLVDGIKTALTILE